MANSTSAKEHAMLFSLVLRGGDIFGILGVQAGAYAFHLGWWPVPITYQIAFVLTALLISVAFPAFGLYRSWRGGSLPAELRRVTAAWSAVITTLIILAFITKTSVLYSRGWLGLWAIGGWLALLIFHSSLRLAARWLRKSGWNVRRVVIVGAGHLGADVAQRIQQAPWSGYDVVGFYDDNPMMVGTKVAGVRVRGRPERLQALLHRGFVDEVWLALPLRADSRVREILHLLRDTTASIRFVPDIFGFQLLNHGISDIAGVPVVDLSTSPMAGINRVIKAVEDRIVAAVILLLISPLFVLLALAVKLTSPGPVFYRQERVSWNGRPFMMLKFRSMPVDTEADTGAVWARRGEQRATFIGSLLRRTSLDELPQFLNVLKGEMSVVGPRPERPIFVAKFKDQIPNYMKKHLVKAGITGWAQVNGWRGDTDLAKRIEFDMQYIERWSVWFDIKIMFLTLVRGFIHKNAY